MPNELTIFPDGGPEAGLWSGGYRGWDRTDASTDAFLRVGRTVVSSVGAELGLLGALPTHVVLVVPGRSSDLDVTVQCYARDRRRAFVRVLLPRGFSALPRGAQRETIARTLVEAAGVAGGPEARDLVSRAAGRARERSFVHRDSSPWKWAPGRRRRARLSGWLADDGFARVVAEVDDGERVRVSAPVRGSTTARRLARTLASLRWRGSDVVELNSAGIRIRGLGESMEIGAARIAFVVRDDGVLAHRGHDDGGSDGGPLVSAVDRTTSFAPIAVTPLGDDALYVELDCGPVADEAARRYAAAVDAYADAIRGDPKWLAWLTDLGIPTVRLTIQLDPKTEGREVTAGRGPAGDKAGVTLRTFPVPLQDPNVSSRQVGDDVTALIEALRGSLGALPPPDLPAVEPGGRRSPHDPPRQE